MNKSKKESISMNTVLSIIAIFISIWSVNVTIKNNNFTQQEVSPAFQINTYIKNGKTMDELINLKGFVNNLSFKKYDKIELISPNLTYVLQYYCDNRLEEKVMGNRWPYLSVCRDKLGERIMKKLQELKSNYDVEIYHILPSTYYEITYQDYKNAFHRELYTKNRNNTLSFIENQSNEQNNNTYKMGSYSVTPFDFSDEMIERNAMRTLQIIEDWQKIHKWDK